MVPKKFFKLFRRFGSVIEVPEFSKLFSINKIHSKLPPYNSLPPGIQENYHIARFFIWISIWSLFDKIVTWNLFLIFFFYFCLFPVRIFFIQGAPFFIGALFLSTNQIVGIKLFYLNWLWICYLHQNFRCKRTSAMFNNANSFVSSIWKSIWFSRKLILVGKIKYQWPTRSGPDRPIIRLVLGIGNWT